MPRTGSTLLCFALQATGIAGHPDESFHPGIREEAQDRKKLGVTDEALFIPRWIEVSMTRNGVFGSKLLAFQTPLLMRRTSEAAGRPYTSLYQALECIVPGARYIHVTREDKEAQAVSYYRALMSNEWHRFRSVFLPDSVGREPFFDPIGIGTCHALAEANDLYWDGYFKTHGIEPLHIVYEELARDFESVMRRVFAFLYLPVGTPVPSPATEKLADAESAEWVARYRALAARQDYRPYSPAECARHWAPY